MRTRDVRAAEQVAVVLGVVSPTLAAILRPAAIVGLVRLLSFLTTGAYTRFRTTLKYTKPNVTSTSWYTTSTNTPQSAVTMYSTSSESLFSATGDKRLANLLSFLLLIVDDRRVEVRRRP